MKARIIKTGEIVDIVQDFDGGWIEVAKSLNMCQRRFKTTDLDLDYEYWIVFRREAAKDILAGIVASSFVDDRWTYKQMAEMAIEQADELIKQLREDEK